jgi:hypothetical protein
MIGISSRHEILAMATAAFHRSSGIFISLLIDMAGPAVGNRVDSD